MLNSLLVKSIIKKDIESGEITADTSKKMDKENPSGTGSFSMNRKADTEVGANSTTEGTENVASGENSHAEGKTSTASGHASHAEGWNSKASGAQAHAEGSSTASGKNSHSEGTATKATSEASHAEGYYTIAGGGSAHAEGNNSSASGNSSHAEGYYAHAEGASSHSEGQYTYSEGTASHSEGEYSKAKGIDSHAEGNRTTALGKTSHSEGLSTNNANTSRIQSDTSNADVISSWESSKFSLAKGEASHVEGKDCMALGDYSHSGGLATRAGYQSQTAIGEYNDNKEENIFEVGNGTSDARSNALELTKSGDLKIGGSYIDGSGNALSMNSANEYTDQKIADLINGAPTTLDTLKEIADAMNENQDVVKALDESIGTKANSSDLTDHTGNTNNPHNVTAEQTPYDNTTSGLSAQNVQDAVDEVNSNLEQLEYSDVAGGKNLVNPSNFIENKMVTWNNGNIIDYQGFFVSGYIEIEPNTTYTKQGFNSSLENWLYDENKLPIHDIGTDTFTSLSNAKYVVLTAPIENKSICMLEKGSTATPYEPYYPSNKMLAENKADKSEVTTNLLKPTLQTTTLNGVTCTNNGDGTYILNGTATGENAVFRVNISCCIEYGKTYRLVGCPQSGGSGKYGLEATDQTIYGVNDYGDGAIFNPYETGYEYKMLIVVYMNHTVNNLVFKPMLTTNLNATYDDFVPFTGTTGKLNGDVAELEKSNEGKMGKENPTGTGAFSMNRKADTTVGDYSTAEGSNCEASAICSHAEGSDTIAKESCSHAEGNSTTASGFYSHSEGYKTTASNTSSHAEGYRTTSSGDYGSHAEGNQTTAKGNSSHAEGYDTTASGLNSHSEGYDTTASGDYSHSGGYRTIAGHNSQTAIGKYNDNKEEDIFEVGNGTSDTSRSNALELTKTGDLKIGGSYIDGSGNAIDDTYATKEELNSFIWKNKKCAFLGDSITEGVGTTVGNRYFDYLANDLGFIAYGYGVNGATTEDVLEQAKTLKTEHGEDIDSIFVFCGTNDFYGANPIGNLYFDGTYNFVQDNLSWTSGGMNENGVQQSYGGWYNSEYIDISEKKYFYINSHAYKEGNIYLPPVIFFDKDKNFLSIVHLESSVLSNTVYENSNYICNGLLKTPKDAKYAVIQKNTIVESKHYSYGIQFAFFCGNNEADLTYDISDWASGGMNENGVQQSYGGWYNSEYIDVEGYTYLYVQAVSYNDGSIILPPVVFFNSSKQVLKYYDYDHDGFSYTNYNSSNFFVKGICEIPKNAKYAMINKNDVVMATDTSFSAGVTHIRNVSKRYYPTAKANNTFSSDVGQLYEYLKTNFPYSQVIVMTPIHRGYATFGSTNVQYDESRPNSIGVYFEEYINTIKKACELWSIPYIDLYNISGLYPVSSVYSDYFSNASTDMLHPNAKGHKRLYLVIKKYLNAIYPTFRDLEN